MNRANRSLVSMESQIWNLKPEIRIWDALVSIPDNHLPIHSLEPLSCPKFLEKAQRRTTLERAQLPGVLARKANDFMSAFGLL
jgi:hypothetical protein